MIGTQVEVHTSPQGAPLGDGTAAYPVRTLDAALTLVRARRTPGQAAVVWLHAGTYQLTGTLELGPRDSRTTIAAWPGDTVVVDGGAPLTGWQPDAIDGRPVWAAPAPATAGRTLVVAGERRNRPSYPRDGWARMTHVPGLDLEADLLATLFDGSTTFHADPADLPELRDPAGAEVVVPHFWIQERMPVADVDRTTGAVTSNLRSILALRDGDAPVPARFRLDGIVDLLGTVPGEWYLDRTGTVATDEHPHGAGHPRVLYAPRDGEDPTTLDAVVPAVSRLLTITGTAADPVREVRIEGITFRHADTPTAPEARLPFEMREDPVLDDVPYASDPQAAATLPGALELRYVHDSVILDCRIEHVSGYGLRLDAGTQGCLVSGLATRSTGAGALTCSGDEDLRAPGATVDNEVSDCRLLDGGHTHPHAVALLLRHAARTRILRNEIAHHASTGIALGWRWDYSPSPAIDNLVEGNHLHDLGRGRLDWFGAIYTLGVSPGTVIRGNLVHDVSAARFGGWGLLLDPSTAHVVVEGNVVHTTSSECLHVKSGRENIVRHNVLAHGGTGLVSLAVLEDHVAATLHHNVLVTDGTPAIAGAPGSLPVDELTSSPHGLTGDLNVLWDRTARDRAVLAGDVADDGITTDASDTWRAAGRDLKTTTANPGLRIADDGTVTLDGTALAELGVRLPTLATGPRTDRPHPWSVRTRPYRPHEAARRPVTTRPTAGGDR